MNSCSESTKVEGMIHFKVADFSIFSQKTDQKLYSEPVVIRGIPWKLIVQPCPNNFLGVFVQCAIDPWGNQMEIMPINGFLAGPLWRPIYLLCSHKNYSKG